MRWQWRLAPDRVLTVGCLVLFALFWTRALAQFGPSNGEVGFSSDSAIPVLMARGPPRGLFGVYYWGQDRFGAWPFLLGWAGSALTGWAWTPERLASAQMLWLLVGALVLVFFRSVGWAASAVFSASLMLHPVVRRTMFALDQPYAWQVSALLLTWLLIRQLISVERHLGLFAAGLASAMFLAIWASPVSGILVLGILAVERWRVCRRSTVASEARRIWGHAGLTGFLLCLTIVAELLLRWVYHRAALAKFGQTYQTLVRGDRGHFTENMRRLVQVALDGTSRLVPLTAMAGLVILGWLLARKDSPEDEERKGPAREGFFLAAGAFAIASINFALCVLLQHVRLNGYAERYLCLTHLFVDLTAAVAWVSIAVWALRRRKMARNPPLALTAVVLVLALLSLPKKATDPDYIRLRELAGLLSKDHSTVLLGQYWSVYPLAALAPPNKLIPVTPEDEGGPRTPFNVQRLFRATEVEVLHAGGRFLDASGQPLRQFTQYGVLLQLAGPAVTGRSDELISLYYNRDPRS